MADTATSKPIGAGDRDAESEGRALTPRSVESSLVERVAEPPGDLPGPDSAAEPAHCGAEFRLVVDCQLSEVPLQVCPEQLDGIELGAVGREVDGLRPGTSNVVAYRLALVEVEVVHHDEVAAPKAGHEGSTDEALKDRAIDGSGVSHEPRLLAQPDCTDDGDSLPVPKRPAADHTLTARPPAVLPTHARLHERLVDEDEPARLHGGDEPAECLAAS